MLLSLSGKLYLPTLVLFLSVAVVFTACSQNVETKYFKDVTATHMPLDAEAHALDVALADVNGDGHLDAILALEAQPNRLYLNDGTGKFSWKKGAFVEKKHDTEHVRLADFNKDGYIDAIFVAEDDHNHEFYLGDGKGNFKDVSERLLTKSEANGLDIGDVNGDGLVDVLIGNSGSTKQNFLWINDSENPGYFIDYTKSGLPAVPTETQSIKLADLNDDGYLDLIAGNEVPPNRLFFNDGKGRYRTGRKTGTNCSPAYA